MDSDDETTWTIIFATSLVYCKILSLHQQSHFTMEITNDLENEQIWDLRIFYVFFQSACGESNTTFI